MIIITLIGVRCLEKNGLDKEGEAFRRGAYIDVSDQGGTDCNAVLRRLYEEN